MKTLISAVLLALAAAWAAPPLSADVDVEIDFHYFHERLSPHGHWIEVDGYGWCWYPAEIDDDWRPYTHGHWVYAEPDGWCWVSDYDDWGWACDHYGRWFHTGHRWVWVPGYHWSGAWVVWRHGGGYVGWAPLPPAVTYEVGVGIHRGNFSFEVDVYEPSWVFCHERYITRTHIHTVVIHHHEHRVIIPRTRVLGSVTVHNRTVITNRAFRVQRAEEVAERPVKRVRLERTATLGDAKVDRERSDRVKVFRPRVKDGDRGNPREVNAVEAERKTLREKHAAERRDGRGGGDVQARQEREVKEVDTNVRRRLERRKPPESRKETPTRRDRDGARNQDQPRRETPQGKPAERPRRETPQGKPAEKPRRETPQGKPAEKPRRETPRGEPEKPRREQPKIRKNSRVPKNSGRVPNGKRKKRGR